MCLKPYRSGVAEYGCGQCIPCRINRARLWSSRLLLEMTQHQASFFCTLTYDDEHLPKDGNLSVRDLQLFMKRLREFRSEEKIRFFAVGEYGDVTLRPHYHLMLFGLSVPKDIVRAWGHGYVHVGSVTRQSCAYITGYTVKGMTKGCDVRLAGRVAEFARMSLRPGIGASAMESVISACYTKGGSGFVASSGDVPEQVRADGKLWPLGRYLKQRIRTALDMGEGETEVHRDARLSVMREKLSEVGAREAHEAKREQTGHRARKLDEIRRSKKGFGL